MKNALWQNIFRNWNQQDSETVLALKKVPVFNKLSNTELSEIEKLVHERNYKPGEHVFKQHAPGEGMFIIVSGSVEISIGDGENKKILAELNEGDFFGEMALLEDEPRSAFAIAKEYSKLLGFFRPDLFSIIERRPRLGSAILMNLGAVLSVRLRKTNELLSEKNQG